MLAVLFLAEALVGEVVLNREWASIHTYEGNILLCNDLESTSCDR